MKQTRAITALIDEACMPPDGISYEKPEEHNATEYRVVTALKDLGHNVRCLGVGNQLEPIIADLTDNRPDLVFNLTEQYRDQRRLDKNIAGLLELLDIPFTGSGSAGLMLCRHKGLCKQLLSSRRIHVPEFAVFPPDRRPRPSRRLRYPLVVKPVYEDGSDGISNASLVKNETELIDRVRMMHEHFDQSAIAEEYIQGRELYVGVLGNRRLRVLPPRELEFGADEGGPVIATYQVKWNKPYQKRWKVRFRNAELPESILTSVERICKKAYRLLQVRDYGRIDLRLTDDNKLVIFEVNPNPGLDTDDEIARAAEHAGMSYTKLIDRIVKLAISRY